MLSNKNIKYAIKYKNLEFVNIVENNENKDIFE
jgi:hypothetical protein